MARLLVKSDGFNNQIIDLKLGVNRVGRSSENDFQIEHPTVSSTHCELTIVGDELVVRDCDSTNGTFVAGDPIKEARLSAGQSFCVGDIELLVESTDVRVEIPPIEVYHKPPPVVRKDGGVLCQRHEDAPVTHQCLKCSELMCEDCVTKLRRRGGKALMLCPFCSGRVEAIGGGKKKKKSILGFLQQTVRLPFAHTSKFDDGNR
jgi:hypothetical protein